MEGLINSLKDWCLNSWDLSDDINDDARWLVKDSFIDPIDDELLENLIIKVASFMTSWLENEGNKRLTIQMEQDFHKAEEMLDSHIRETF